ncbi:hypothetical protein ACFQU2_08475 [Siccirubricoccus deserti]
MNLVRIRAPLPVGGRFSAPRPDYAGVAGGLIGTAEGCCAPRATWRMGCSARSAPSAVLRPAPVAGCPNAARCWRWCAAAAPGRCRPARPRRRGRPGSAAGTGPPARPARPRAADAARLVRTLKPREVSCR